MLCAGIDPRSRLGELPEQPPVAESELPGSDSSAGQVFRVAAGLGNFAAGSLAAIGLRFS